MYKKFVILASLMCCFAGFVACEEDEETEYNPTNALEGKWDLSKIGVLNSQSNLNYVNVDAACGVNSITFQADSTFVDSNFELGTCNAIGANGSYSIIGGNLVRTYSADSVATHDVFSLTGDMMELVYTDTIIDKILFLQYRKAE